MEGGSVRRLQTPGTCPNCGTFLPQLGIEHFAGLEKPMP
jgi:hypothetical protein